MLALLRGADMTEQLTVLAKTGLCALSEEQVCALENYAYTWSPNAAAWRAEFAKNPKGFGENELTDEDRQNLAWAEDARRKLVDAVDALRGKVKGGNAEQISRAVYFCLKELGPRNSRPGWWRISARHGASRRQRKPPASGTWSWGFWTRWRSCWANRP